MLLDTDIGSDIDDAVALAYLLHQPQCELLGITTVSGEPDRRAALAHALLRGRWARRCARFMSDYENPPAGSTRFSPRAPQARVLAPETFAEFSASDCNRLFLRETIRAPARRGDAARHRAADQPRRAVCTGPGSASAAEANCADRAACITRALSATPARREPNGICAAIRTPAAIVFRANGAAPAGCRP